MILTALQADEAENEKFRCIYNKYSALVYHIAMCKLGSHEKAEDCVQDTFLYLAQNMKNIGDVESKSTKCYISTIAEGKAISLFRREMLRVHDNIEHFSAQADASTLDNYEAVDLSAALDSLPDELRNIVILKYYYGYKSKEIAEFYGISPSLVRKKLQKGINMLKDEMKGA